MTVSTIALATTGIFGGGGGTGGSPSKDKGTLTKWLDRLADALKRLAGKAVEALPAILGSVVGVISSFLGKAIAFVGEHTWALIVLVVWLIGWWLMQVKKDLAGHGAWPGFCCGASLMFVLFDSCKTFPSCLMP